MAKANMPGDRVRQPGTHVREGRVRKVKPDGTKVVQGKLGQLDEQKSPDKPVDRPTQY